MADISHMRVIIGIEHDGKVETFTKDYNNLGYARVLEIIEVMDTSFKAAQEED